MGNFPLGFSQSSEFRKQLRLGKELSFSHSSRLAGVLVECQEVARDFIRVHELSSLCAFPSPSYAIVWIWFPAFAQSRVADLQYTHLCFLFPFTIYSFLLPSAIHQHISGSRCHGGKSLFTIALLPRKEKQESLGLDLGFLGSGGTRGYVVRPEQLGYSRKGKKVERVEVWSSQSIIYGAVFHVFPRWWIRAHRTKSSHIWE